MRPTSLRFTFTLTAYVFEAFIFTACTYSVWVDPKAGLLLPLLSTFATIFCIVYDITIGIPRLWQREKAEGEGLL